MQHDRLSKRDTTPSRKLICKVTRSQKLWCNHLFPHPAEIIHLALLGEFKQAIIHSVNIFHILFLPFSITWRPQPPPPPYLLRYFISPSFVLDYSQLYLPYPFRFPPCSGCESSSRGQNLVYWTVTLCGKNVFPSIHAFPFNYLGSRFHNRRQTKGSFFTEMVSSSSWGILRRSPARWDV